MRVILTPKSTSKVFPFVRISEIVLEKLVPVAFKMAAARALKNLCKIR
jgi:hypothetical protein